MKASPAYTQKKISPAVPENKAALSWKEEKILLPCVRLELINFTLWD